MKHETYPGSAALFTFTRLSATIIRYPAAAARLRNVCCLPAVCRRMKRRGFKMMKLFDLHCDTIVELKKRKEDFIKNTTQFSLTAAEQIRPYVQAMAIFVPDDTHGQAAIDYVDTYSSYLDRLTEKHRDLAETADTCADITRILNSGKCALIRTLESGSALGGRLDMIETYARRGFKMMTLVWNGENELASGHDTQNGLSDFGKEAVRRMEKAGMIVDCSHLNDIGFGQLCETAEKPFVASHSNCRAVCSHKRNLTDAQFTEIVRRKGIVGLNLYRNFLDDDGNGTPEMLFRHVYHMLELGGEDAIACGSDFDGAVIGPELDSPVKFAGMADYFSRMGLSDEVIQKIFFDNAMRFFTENIH